MSQSSIARSNVFPVPFEMRRGRGLMAPGPVVPASLAEEVGFEPTIGLHLFRFSRPALSTAQAPLRMQFRSAVRAGSKTCEDAVAEKTPKEGPHSRPLINPHEE